LLLAGAFAGMTLGTVAHAQVAFRSASSATQPIPTFRAANSASEAAALVPTFKSFVATLAAAATGGADPTVTLPAHAADDILLLATIVRSNTATVATPAGWTQIGTPTVRSTVATYQFFWKRAASGAETNPLINRTGTTGDVYAAVSVYQGAFASGDPWEVKGPVVTGTTDPSVITGITTLTANSLVVVAVAGEDNNNASIITTGTNPAAYTEHYIESATGADGVITFSEFVRTTAGATGNVSVNWDVAVPIGFGGIVLALRPVTQVLTITKPAGTVTNDVMIASFGFRANQPGLSTDIVITPPAGWTLVRRLDNPGPTDNGLAVYQKTAGAGEPANYTWGLTCIATCATNGFQAAQGGILSFYNVNTTTPVDVENGQPTAIGAQTTPSVITTVANAMLVASHSYATAGPWTPPPASGGDAAMTEAVDVLSGAQSTEMSYVLHAVAGATVGKQATPAPDDDVGNAHILALRPAQQSSISINKPAGTILNDVMIASIGFSPNTLTVTGVPAGWTLVNRVDNTNANANSLAVYRLAAGAAEPASYTWTFSAAGYLAGAILTFSGVDTANPLDTPEVKGGNCTQQGSCATATLSHATPSVTTTVANMMLVTSHTYSSAGTWTPPGGMTEPVNADVQHGNQSLGVNYVLQAAAGATGTKTATASTQADVGNAHILALKPVVTVPTPGSFNAFETSTAAGAITGVIKTKIAGSAFSLDVVAIASGAQQAGFTDAVIVELLGNNTLGVSLDAQNCPTSSTLVQTVAPNPTITGGRSTVNFAAVAESWRDVRVRVRWPTSSPTVTWCSTDNFAIRPNTLASFAVTDTDWQTTGTPGARALNLLTFAATTPTHKAGRPFSVRATAVNAAAATTTNYVGAPMATLSACGSAACTATFGALTLTTTFVAGQLTSDVASYDNVGSFSLQLVDSIFASVDAADTTGDCTAAGRYVCSATINVGRFVPDHFTVVLNTPVFTPACNSFTYIGQAFSYTTAPVITVTARDFAANPTTLYNTIGSWFRITSTSLTGKAYTAVTGGTPDTSGLPGTDPVILSSGAGVGTLTFGSGTGLFFTRTTPTAPASPYDADISLAINVIDADGVTYASNPSRFGTATAGNGIAFSDGNALTTNDKQMRFGRLVIRNVNGSQLVPLPVQVEAQYWSGAPTNAFITNAQDSCTSIASANDAMGSYTSNLSGSPTCETAISGGGTLSAGRKTLQLAAPGSGNNGSVDLAVNLGASASGNTCTTLGGAPVSATTANLPHLQGNWTGGAYNVNPSARATFGVFKGAEEVIFVRENF
jgi:MSHA biogenesis protein MshQ